MPPRKRTPKTDGQSITDYRHGEKRKNIPPAGLAAQGKVQDVPRTRYAYDPHLPPVLRFDETGAADCLPELIEIAKQRTLTDEEAQVLAEALRNHQPWLEWSGKREKRWFEVDPVALHIHERVSAQAILKLAAREPIQRSLFADPEMEYREAVQFYQHDVDWSNRLILGDSLVVLNSLAGREDLAGKVQMIYFDPPYGIKFASNFQSLIGKRDVKDKEADLTREPEQVKAYRDTWTLGIHTYLSYLRDRLLVARDLLHDSGSIFVQISDENLHRVKMVLDEVFLPENFCGHILYRRGGFQTSGLIPQTFDHILWYGKMKGEVIKKYHALRTMLGKDDWFSGQQKWIRLSTGELINYREGTEGFSGDLFSHRATYSATGSEASQFPVLWNGSEFLPPKGRGWSSNVDGINRLKRSERLLALGKSLRFLVGYKDFQYGSLTNGWTDTVSSGFGEQKIYAVQTASMIIERCMLMTTSPGDLVLDPTCGSGTTAYVAEQWGRRWITIDTSRVAIALARQRLLTAKYDFYELHDPDAGPQSGFNYKTVPHITLKSIAQNQALDPIFERWELVLVEKLAVLNQALKTVTPELRAQLQVKLLEKERREGKKSITDGDRRRWLLPKPGEDWKEWEVPFDTDLDWPKELQEALVDYRKAWRGKMDEVNATIAASAPQEELVDQPQVKPGVLRVSGPFTVEGVQPVEDALDIDDDTPIGGAPEELEAFPDVPAVQDEPTNAAAFLDKMIRLLRNDGVRFPDNKKMDFSRLDSFNHPVLHAEGEWASNGNADARRVAVRFGPQYGAITAQMVEEAIWAASRGGFDDLVLAGFAVDGAAQAIIQDDPNPRVHCHMAYIRPDVNMGDLLKDTPSSQLFTVFGLPRVELKAQDNGEWVVEMQGVDVYDPVENSIQSTGASKVAAWFLDSDYDGQTFCVSQAFFPDSSAWDKLAKALKTVVDPERFDAFSGTESLPFPAGEHNRIAVKVIDPRGNEVMRVMELI